MTDRIKLTDLSDEETIGLLALTKFAQTCIDSVGPAYIAGTYFWAVHKSDPAFEAMHEDIPNGTGKFDSTNSWFVGFCNKVGVAAAQGEHFGDKVLLAVLVGGSERKILLSISDIKQIDKLIPEGKLTTKVLVVNSKGSSGISN